MASFPSVARSAEKIALCKEIRIPDLEGWVTSDDPNNGCEGD